MNIVLEESDATRRRSGVAGKTRQQVGLYRFIGDIEMATAWEAVRAKALLTPCAPTIIRSISGHEYKLWKVVASHGNTPKRPISQQLLLLICDGSLVMLASSSAKMPENFWGDYWFGASSNVMSSPPENLYRDGNHVRLISNKVLEELVQAEPLPASYAIKFFSNVDTLIGFKTKDCPCMTVQQSIAYGVAYSIAERFYKMLDSVEMLKMLVDGINILDLPLSTFLRPDADSPSKGGVTDNITVDFSHYMHGVVEAVHSPVMHYLARCHDFRRDSPIWDKSLKEIMADYILIKELTPSTEE